MKFVERAVILALGIAMLVALHQIVGVVFVAHGWRGLSPSDWAAWVQAVGSIAALGVAIFVMSRQNAHSTRLVVQANDLAILRRAQTVSIMVESSHWQMDASLSDIANAVRKGDVTDMHISLMATKVVMTEVRARLITIPIHDLGSTMLAEGVIRLTEISGVAVRLVDGWEGPSNTKKTGELLAALQTKASDAITVCRNGVKTLEKSAST